MSVPEGMRKESDMEFLKIAKDIEELFLDLRIHKPKRYYFFIDKLLDCACNIMNSVKFANSIYPENKNEAKERQLSFKKGIGQCQVLVSQIEIIRHKFRDDGIAIGQVEQLSILLNKEIKLIKGIILKDKNRYAKLPN